VRRAGELHWTSLRDRLTGRDSRQRRAVGVIVAARDMLLLAAVLTVVAVFWVGVATLLGWAR
jgi:hypothetical protein